MQIILDIDHKAFDAALKKVPQQVTLDVGSAIGISLRDVARLAKRTHRFKNQSGNAEAHIMEEVFPSGLSGEVRLERGGCDYIGYLHTGTKKHPIAPKSGKALHWVSGGKSFFSSGHIHPGTKKDEFLFRAFRRLTPSIQTKLKNAVATAIKKAGF